MERVRNMKNSEDIDRIEKSLPETLRKCRYCGERPDVYIRADRNYAGTKGFISTVRCPGCYVSVFAFGLDRRSAEIMSKCYWEKGVLDA